MGRKKAAIIMSTREGGAKGQCFDDLQENGFENATQPPMLTFGFLGLERRVRTRRKRFRLQELTIEAGFIRDNRSVQFRFSITWRSALQRTAPSANPSFS